MVERLWRRCSTVRATALREHPRQKLRFVECFDPNRVTFIRVFGVLRLAACFADRGDHCARALDVDAFVPGAVKSPDWNSGQLRRLSLVAAAAKWDGRGEHLRLRRYY